MKLFKYEGYTITISEEAFALKAFRDIWNKDTTNSKEKATMELAYVYFMEDPRSDYQYIIDKEERSKAIKEGEGLKPTWKPDKKVLEAMKLYSSFKTSSALLLEDTRIAVDKLRKYIRDINLEDTDNNGKPIYTLNTITSTIKQIPGLIKDLDEAERTLAKEIAQNDKVRGAQEKSIYEDM